MLTSDIIQNAKLQTKYTTVDHHHEHDDCIRIAYEWLDAQTKTKSVSRSTRPLKHIIEKWGGRYVSQSDVEVAANLHKELFGIYPYYNISSRMTLPNFSRLENVAEANKHPDKRGQLDEKMYFRKENT